MKKSLLALGILAAFTGSAFAQSSVTMYGLLDAGITYEGAGPIADAAGGYRLSLQSGISQSSNIGIRGVEDLGGSLKALFQLEAGFQLNNGQSSEAGALFNRASWLGLSGDFGTVKAGRMFTPLYSALESIDPFEIGYVGTANNLMNVGGANQSASNPGGNSLTNGGGSQWQNNSLRYVSHDYYGLSGEVNYGFGGQAGSTGGARELGGTLNYKKGPLAMLISYDGVNTIDNSNKFNTTLLGASIDWAEFGVPVKTSLGYAINKGSNVVGGFEVDSTDLLLGARIPFGPHEFLGSYIHHNDKTFLSLNADQFALGYTYSFSKRTTLYSSIGLMNNKNGAIYTLGNSSNAGFGRKAVDLGMRHSF